MYTQDASINSSLCISKTWGMSHFQSTFSIEWMPRMQLIMPSSSSNKIDVWSRLNNRWKILFSDQIDTECSQVFWHLPRFWKEIVSEKCLSNSTLIENPHLGSVEAWFVHWIQTFFILNSWNRIVRKMASPKHELRWGNAHQYSAYFTHLTTTFNRVD